MCSRARGARGRRALRYRLGALRHADLQRRQDADENMAAVLSRRAANLRPPIQMCDALSRNVPKLAPGVNVTIANCLARPQTARPVNQ